MFFRKRREQKEMEEIREKLTATVKDLLYEVVAQNHIAVKAGIYTADEFQKMTNQFVEEAENLFEDLDPIEIMDKRMEDRMGSLPRVIKVEI